MRLLRRVKIPALLLLAGEIFLLAFFPPSLILAPTITAGGDTPSHFISTLAMQADPSACLSPVTWVHGNYAGFPLFLNYFPLPFAVMAFISLLIPLTIAFKLVTLLAVIPLPLAVFYCLRRLGSKGHVPALGALFSIQFLFMTENSMWGGNICSTLAGEFSFGIAFILAICLTGRLFRDAAEHKSLVGNAFLEALIALGSGYPLLHAGTGTSFFLMRKGCIRYILCLHALAFGLIGFWILPLIFRLSWGTPYAHTWLFQSWTEILPPLLWPAAAGALIGLYSHIRTLPRNLRGLYSPLKSDSSASPELYLWWQFGTALLGFSLAPALGLVDIRFLPFAQIMLVMLGAIGWGRVIMILPRPNAWMTGFAAIILVIAASKAPTINSWVQWNYSGMESKPLAQSFERINAYIRGSENSPRVVYEHSEMHNAAGTTRAFEMLPVYSGRSTLEGLYMQSSISSPFVFYIQSELSHPASCPYAQYYYSRPDPERAAKHLALFNVSQVIAITDNIANALDYSPEYVFQAAFPPYTLYGLAAPADSYVEPVRFQPRRISHTNWRQVQFDWFRRSSLTVPLVVASEKTGGDFWQGLPVYAGMPENIPEIPILAPGELVKADAVLGKNRITITTDKPGHPLWIKESYSPDWKISEGGGELYMASPAFMLLVPQCSRTVLTFDTGSGPYLFGKILSLLALASCAALLLIGKHRRAENLAAPTPAQSVFPVNARFFAAAAVLAGIVVFAAATRSHRDPLLIYESAKAQYEKAEETAEKISSGRGGAEDESKKERLLQSASALFDECMQKYPDSSIFDHCLFFKIRMLTAAQKWEEASSILERFLPTHPDTRIYSDCLLVLGTARLHAGDSGKAEEYFRKAALTWPESTGARQAGRQLAQMSGPETILAEAREHFAAEQYPAAYLLSRSLSFNEDEKIRNESLLLLAYCSYHMQRWEEAANLFTQWLSANFDSPESEEAQHALSRCSIIAAQNRAWQTEPDEQGATARSGWVLPFSRRTD